jgi:hypothetical protein
MAALTTEHEQEGKAVTMEPVPSPKEIMARRVEDIVLTRNFCPSRAGKEPRPVTVIRVQHELDAVADGLRRLRPVVDLMDDLKAAEIHTRIVGERISEAMVDLARYETQALGNGEYTVEYREEDC